jgi:alkanesulfonate monooxygenase SsuD/methylene tetrahydromethanopterin reductase-like flavin-dependent oxidoreductase (luciferase family)
LVPDEMIGLFTVGGTPEDVQARIGGLADLKITGVNFMPIGPERTQSYQLFAEALIHSTI